MSNNSVWLNNYQAEASEQKSLIKLSTAEFVFVKCIKTDGVDVSGAVFVLNNGETKLKIQETFKKILNYKLGSVYALLIKSSQSEFGKIVIAVFTWLAAVILLCLYKSFGCDIIKVSTRAISESVFLNKLFQYFCDFLQQENPKLVVQEKINNSLVKKKPIKKRKC